MVSWRTSAGSNASSASTPSSPSSPKCVNFSGVTSVSRQVTTEEQWSLYLFEIHADACSSCADPYLRYKGGKKLCRDGERLALDVVKHLYREDGEICSRTKDDGKTVRVEIPAGYDRCLALLKAVQRSVKQRVPFLPATKKSSALPRTSSGSSPQTSTLPEPRAPVVSARGNPQPTLQRSTSTGRSSYSRADFTLSGRTPTHSHHSTVRDWTYGTSVPASLPAPETRQPRYEGIGPSARTANRGSLYGEDMTRMMEQQRLDTQSGYRLEVREPPRHQHTGHLRRQGKPFSGLFS